MRQRVKFNIGDLEIDGDDYFAVIEPVYWAVNIYDGPERYEEDLATFSTEQRLVLAYHWYMCEVNNGGHDQFYYNTGIVWPDALRAFAEIGPTEVASLIQESVNRLGGNVSLDTDERRDQLEQMDVDFQDLDQRLFELEKQPDFGQKISEFIRRHREKFYFSGLVAKW